MRREVVARIDARMSEAEVLLEAVSKRFAPEKAGAPPPAALDRISIAVAKGEMVVVVGPSGLRGSRRRSASWRGSKNRIPERSSSVDEP